MESIGEELERVKSLLWDIMVSLDYAGYPPGDPDDTLPLRNAADAAREYFDE